MECVICNENILEDQPKIELLCEHVYHTECFLHDNYHLPVNRVRCNQCNETENDEYENNDTDLINLLWESNTNFKESIIAYNKSLKNRNKTLQQLRSKIKSIVNANDFSSYITIMKNKLNEMKNLVKNSEEYKSSNSQQKSIIYKSNKIFQTWNIPVYTIYHVLRNNETAQEHVKAPIYRSGLSRIMSKFTPRFNKF